MFFSKDLTAREDALKDEIPDDIYIPYNAGRRIGMGLDTLNRRMGDFNSQPLPYEVSLKAWIGYKFGTGGFSGAVSTYLLSNKCYITSFGTDVTYTAGTNSAAIVCPSTNRLLSINLFGTSADISGSGTFTITVNLGNATLNNGYTTMYPPTSFQVYDNTTQSVSGPSTTNPFIVDNSINTVQKEIVGVSGGVITLRVSNLQVYEKWMISLTF